MLHLSKPVCFCYKYDSSCSGHIVLMSDWLKRSRASLLPTNTQLPPTSLLCLLFVFSTSKKIQQTSSYSSQALTIGHFAQEKTHFHQPRYFLNQHNLINLRKFYDRSLQVTATRSRTVNTTISPTTASQLSLFVFHLEYSCESLRLPHTSRV